MENTVSKKTSSKTKRRSPAAQVFRRLMKNKSSFIAKLMDNIGYVATEFFK